MENMTSEELDQTGITYFYRVVVTSTGRAIKKGPKRERHEIQCASRKDAIRCALETCSGDIESVRVTLLRNATDEENADFARIVNANRGSMLVVIEEG